MSQSSSQTALQLIQNIIKFQTFQRRMNAKSRRKIKAESKSKGHTGIKPQGVVTSQQALKRLSFSFYAQDTIKRSKQIIFDDCQFLQDLPIVTVPAKRPLFGQSSTRANSRLSKPKKRDSMLEMEQFFIEHKCDQIQLVPTNASHNEGGSGEGSPSQKKAMSRAIISKNKRGEHEVKPQVRKCRTALGQKSVGKRESSRAKEQRKL